MSKLDWKGIIGTVAPTIATALGGPLAGVAVKTLASQLLGKPDASAAEVEAAIASADPQTLLKLKDIDTEFKKFVLISQLDLDRVNAADRASARDREVRTGDSTPKVLAYSVTLGFFGILTLLLCGQFPDDGHDALLVMLGSLGTAWVAIVTYYFGSSASGRAKDETISTIAKMP